jgi:hypothetical protein
VDYAVELLEQNCAFGEVIRSGEPSTPIPTCPGCSLSHVLRHVLRGDRVRDGSVLLRGGAVNLLLALVRRVRLEDTDIAVSGDASIWHNWLGRTPF